MLASNKTSEQTSISEGSSTVPLSMSVDDEAAVQAIVSASSVSPDMFNPSDFLTSPLSPWEDLLSTPAVDADMGMTPDIYTSPALMSFGDDFDQMPSLFGPTGYEGYDAKVATSAR